MLEARNVVKRFRGLVAVDGVSLKIDPGEIRCIIGPNGAGKTTLFNLLTGDIRPDAGQVLLGDRRIDGLPDHRIARLGVVRKFQVPAVFPDMSVIDNLRVAADGTRRLASLLRGHRDRKDTIGQVMREMLLEDRAEMAAGQLGHGEVQRLEIAMVLATQPRVLLLDEPTAGMSLDETRQTAELLKRLAERHGVTIVIVEHDIDFIKGIGDRITVLYKGKVLVEGPHSEIEKSNEVRRVYLGEGL
jgi:urea ABC transporter ATP-binding protein UrtD